MGERQLDSNQSRGKLSCLTAENTEVQWAGQAANTKDKIKTSFLWIRLYKNPDEITAPADFPPLITWASVSGDGGIALALRKEEGKLLQPFLCAHGPGWSTVALPEGNVPSLFCCSCTSAPDIATCYQLQVGLGTDKCSPVLSPTHWEPARYMCRYGNCSDHSCHIPDYL